MTLVGATTENPSFELNARAAVALPGAGAAPARRCRARAPLLERAEAALGSTLPLDEQGRQALFAMADGDGRYLITLAEQLAAAQGKGPVPPERLATLLQKRAPLYDKARRRTTT